MLGKIEDRTPASLQSSRVQAALRTPNCSQGVLGNLRLAELDAKLWICGSLSQ